MFELQVRNDDGLWTPIWRGHENEVPIEALRRLIKLLENLKNMQVFKPDTRYRVIFLKFFLLAD